MISLTHWGICMAFLAQAPALLGQERPPTGVGAVQLTLLRQLESGKSRVGSNVPFAVAKDVLDAYGAVIIPKGSYAVGTVVGSRAEGPLSAALLDRPARLSIRFDFVFDANGRQIPLAASRRKPNEPLRLSRDYTSVELEEDQKIAEGLRDARHRELLEKLLSVLSDGGFQPTKKEEAELGQMLDQLEMSDAAEIIRTGGLEELLTTMRRLANARTSRALLANTSFKAVPTALNAVCEIVKIGRRGIGFLKGTLKGRNIRAFPGCDFVAYIVGPD